MPPSISSLAVLDESKRNLVITLLTNGSSRRVAARFVGCAPSTITRTAARDPQFGAQLGRAEQTAEIGLLRCIQSAAKNERYWRAAAWLLERRNPEDFASRHPRLLTFPQVAEMLSQVVEILRGDLPEDNCRRALQKLEDLILEFNAADRPLIIDVIPETPDPEPPTTPDSSGPTPSIPEAQPRNKH